MPLTPAAGDSSGQGGELHKYDSVFFEYIQSGSTRSARTVIPVVLRHLSPASVLDVGCGAGAWLREYAALGVKDFLGVDGAYVRLDELLIPSENFVAFDLTRVLNLNRQFDLVQCIEVAEHLPASKAATLVDNLTRHGNVILFAAAVPGQGGEDHINEQPYEYWAALFAERGFHLYDFLRPQIANNTEVEPWYRYNSLLFVHHSLANDLPQPIASTRVANGGPIADVSPLAHRVRKALLRQLPPKVVSRLAVAKHRMVLWRARMRSSRAHND